MYYTMYAISLSRKRRKRGVGGTPHPRLLEPFVELLVAAEEDLEPDAHSGGEPAAVTMVVKRLTVLVKRLVMVVKRRDHGGESAAPQPGNT